MIISTVTSTTIFIFLVSRQKTANYPTRVAYGELIICVIFLVLALSCLVLTNVSPTVYYVFLLVSNFISTLGTSVAQNGSFAIVNLFDPIYTQAIMLGQAVAGILPPIVSIMSAVSAIHTNALREQKGLEPSPISKASLSSFFYFIVASSIALIAFTLFSIVVKKEPVRLRGETDLLISTSSRDSDYHSIDQDDESVIPNGPSKHVLTHEDAVPATPLELFQKLRVPATTVFLVFSVTLAYPVFSQTVQPIHTIDSSVLFARQVFVPLSLLIWNIGDFLGRLICGKASWVVQGDKHFLIYAAGRAGFIPIYLICCNVNGRGGLFNSDSLFFVIHFLFGLTNGHLGSSAFMRSGSYVDEHQKEQAGSFMTMALSFGLTAGAFFSFFLVACLHE